MNNGISLKLAVSAAKKPLNIDHKSNLKINLIGPFASRSYYRKDLIPEYGRLSAYKT
jgi:hypothetical protein